MTIKAERINVTTAADGTGSATSTRALLGKLYAVEWIDGDYADGVDGTLSVTDTASGVDVTITTLTNANNDAWYYPRTQVHDAAGAGVTYDGTNEVYDCAIIAGSLKLAIEQGGNAKTGGCIVYYYE